jgi:hypothetical protein
MSVTQSEKEDYSAAMAHVAAAGVQVVSLFLPWDDVEKKPGEFQSPYPKIANAYYPPRHIQVSLRLATLDTNQNRIPADLQNKPFDDPAVISRFNRLVDYIFDQMPDVQISELSIGNEIDCSLGTDAAKWDQYIRFFMAAREHARERRKGLNVGASITFNGHVGKSLSFARAINQHADVAMVSYYPLTPDFKVREPKTVHDDFNAICKQYLNQPVSFVEAGYPSGNHCDSSELMQRQFIDEIFAAWDEHAGQVQSVTFVWLSDASASSVEAWKHYYGLAAPAFLDYLSTLGLRTFKDTGADKQAFGALKQEAQARGWQ